MPSGNKIIGQVYAEHMNLQIYISSKTLTQGLCGSFDGNQDNDIFDRHTNRTSMTTHNSVIDARTSASWRQVNAYHTNYD